MTLVSYAQRRAQGYITIPEAARILECHESTIRLKQKQFSDLFVEVDDPRARYMIQARDLPNLQITSTSVDYSALRGLSKKLDSVAIYTIKSLAEVLGIQRRLVSSFIEQGLTDNRMTLGAAKSHHRILGQEVIDFLRKRARYATIPEMELAIGISAYFIREYVDLGLVRTINFRDGNPIQYIARRNANRIRRIYEEEHPDGSYRKIARGSERGRGVRRWTDEKTIEGKVIEIMHSEGTLASNYMKKNHNYIYDGVRKRLKKSWSEYITGLSQRYKDQGHEDTADEIIDAFNNKPSRGGIPRMWTNIRIVQGLVTLIIETPDLDHKQMQQTAEGRRLYKSAANRLGWDTAMEMAREYLERTQEAFPKVNPAKAVQLIDIIDQEQTNIRRRELIEATVNKGGELGTDIVFAWHNLAGYLADPDRVLGVVAERTPLSRDTLDQLLRYQSILSENKRILGDEWEQVSAQDFEVYIGLRSF